MWTGDTLDADETQDGAKVSRELLYISDSGFPGSDSFTYAATDELADSDPAIVTISRSGEPDRVAKPVLTAPGLTFQHSIHVEISCATPGATIRYTTNGTPPSRTNGTVCSSGKVVSLTQTTTLKAIACKTGMTDSDVATAMYTKHDGPLPETITLDLGAGVTMMLVKIPGGSFQMGTSLTDYEWSEHARPVHTVTFSAPFYMGKYEVTQAQYEAVMGTNPSCFSGDNRPVEDVSWYDAVAFCEALSTQTGYTVRLPSEAEWEYACKAGSGDTKFHFGNDEAQLGDYAWYDDNVDGGTHDVGGKLPNAFGLYDMHGNVWEWCQDWLNESYSGAPGDGSAWTTGDSSFRLMRGGSYCYGASDCCSACRSYDLTPGACINVGFRVVVVAVGVE